MRTHDRPNDTANTRGGISRRRLLRFSALGGVAVAATAAGLLAGPLAIAEDDIPDWTTADIADLSGLRVIVTGGNGYPEGDRSGLGFHCAAALAAAGADVIIASRNETRGAEAVRMVQRSVASAAIRFERVDLADLASVRAFAQRMQQEGRPIDLLVNNAGVMGRRDREVSVDGFERVLATNTIGHFALTGLLLPLLQNADQPRVVWVGSGRTASSLPFDDLQLERSYEYGAAYDNSKLANLLLAFELDRRARGGGWKGMCVAAHPGVAHTNLIPDGPGMDSAEGWRLRFLPFLFQPPADGALPILYAATASEVTPGSYYGPNGLGGIRGLPGVASVPAPAQDQAAAARLWVALERLTGVSYG